MSWPTRGPQRRAAAKNWPWAKRALDDPPDEPVRAARPGPRAWFRVVLRLRAVTQALLAQPGRAMLSTAPKAVEQASPGLADLDEQPPSHPGQPVA
jgi:hypothetical protein